MSEDHITITSGGDTYFAKDQAIQNINRVISQAPDVPENIETKLKELAAAVEKMMADMPDDKSAKTAKNLKTFTEEAVSKEPDQDYLAISKKGLIEAAQAVGAIGQPVIGIVQSLMKLFVP